MRLRLVHTLSLWFLAAVAVTVIGMGGVTAWHLGQGFAAYLEARDLERLDKFADVVAEAAQAAGGAEALLQRQLRMRGLLDELARREGLTSRSDRLGAGEPGSAPRERMPEAPPPPPGPGALQGADPPPGDRAGSPPPRRGPGGGPPPPPGGGGPGALDDGFAARVVVVHLDGRPLLGRPLPPGASIFAERPVVIDGQTVALVRLRPAPRAPDANESRFLRSQYQGIAVVALLAMLLALGSAAWLARQWVRPLQAVQQATARIAQGELFVRLPRTRHDEIGDVAHNVNLMAEGLQRLEGSRRRWLAEMSHELRTPLSVLRGEIEALTDGIRPLTPAAVRSLHEEVLRLGALVDDLHLLAMADLQALPCRMAPADAVAIVQAALRRFETRAVAAGLTLQWLASPPATLPLVCDSARIEQLVANLLENSLRYTHAPGQVGLRVQKVPGGIELQIEDSAPGVPLADQPHLFDPLYRTDAARSRQAGGSGLGLAIAQAIVLAHGGRIHAQDAALGGLCISVELPDQPPAAKSAARTDS